MIAQGFGVTRDFMKEWNNSVYFRLKKIPCGFKEQVRARPSGEKCGLTIQMKANTLYMFIDEGVSFDFSPRGTKYFTLSSLTEKRPSPTYNKLRSIKYDLLENGINSDKGEFVPQPFRNQRFHSFTNWNTLRFTGNKKSCSIIT